MDCVASYPGDRQIEELPDSNSVIAPVRRVLIAQLGARRHYAVPRVLYQAGILDSLVTDACADIPPWRWLGALVPDVLRGAGMRRLMGRSVPGVPARHIVGTLFLDLSARRDRRSGESHSDSWARRNAEFCRRVARRGFGNADCVYAFNGAALEIFRAAREQDLRTVLDQTAAPWRWNARLLREEINRWPGWEDRPAELDESGMLSKREEGEWELADIIVCGSEFCRSTLIEFGVPDAKCHVLPYPTFISPQTPRDVKPVNPGRPMRVLFAGTLQLRKGIQYLYEAARSLSAASIEYRLVGPSLLSDDANRKLAGCCDAAGAVPRSGMADQYRWADVLVLPTLSEGSANVCHEAMAAGLPVITTAAAGSVIQDGENGLVVPDRDAGALAAAIELMARDPAERGRLGEAAAKTIRLINDMDQYTDRLRSVLEHGG